MSNTAIAFCFLTLSILFASLDKGLMKAFRWHSLKTRVTVLTLVIFVLGIWSLTFYASRMLREDMVHVLGEQQFSTVAILAYQVDDAVKDRSGVLAVIAAKITPPMMGNAAALQAEIEDRPVLESMFTAGAYVVRMDGQAIASIPVSVGRVGLNYMDQAHVATALKEGKPALGKPRIGKALKTPVLGMSTPIRDAEGKVIGALIGVIDLSRPNFLSKITGVAYGETGNYVIIAPQDRMVITATDKSRIMQKLPAPGVNPGIDRFIHACDGYAVFRGVTGVEQLASCMRMPFSGWNVGAILPTEEAFAPIHDMQQRMLLAALLLTLFLGGLTWWVLRRELAPMLDTAKILGELAESSKPLHALPITHRDEIGDLIGGFNCLLDIVAQREQALRDSQQKLANIIWGTGVGTWEWNVQTGETHFNERWAELIGHTLDELAPVSIDTWTGLAHPDDQARSAAVLARHFAGEIDYYEFEARMRHKAGHWIWVLDRGRLVSRTPDGQPEWMAGTQSDITERKQAEGKLSASERNLRLQFDGAMDGILILNPRGEIESVNESFAAMHGYTVEKMRLMRLQDLDTPGTASEVPKRMQRIMSGESLTFEVEHYHRDGHVFPLEVSANLISSGTEPLIQAFHRDITERKQADLALQESEYAFRTVLEASTDAVLLQDSTAAFVECNQAALDLLRMTREQFIHMTPDQISVEFQPNGRRSEEYAPEMTALGWKGFHRFEWTCRKFDGGEFVVEVSLVPITLKGQQMLHCTWRDITGRRQAEAEILRSNAELEQFSYAISHDMRQPLRMISSYMQLLEKDLADHLDAEKRQYFNFAIDGAKRMDAMMLGLLDYSRVGRKGEPPAWIESRAVLDEALLFLQPAIAEAKAVVRIEGEWPRIHVSPNEILRLMQNLIVNAIKFRIAECTPEVTVTGEINGDEWRMCVSDNGIGILPSQIDRLFQVFQRLQSRADYEGTGIGLALCRKIAEHHGGRIWAESVGAGLGSQFCVALPQERVEYLA